MLDHGDSCGGHGPEGTFEVEISRSSAEMTCKFEVKCLTVLKCTLEMQSKRAYNICVNADVKCKQRAWAIVVNAISPCKLKSLVRGARGTRPRGHGPEGCMRPGPEAGTRGRGHGPEGTGWGPEAGTTDQRPGPE